jgi:hypothetical protein
MLAPADRPRRTVTFRLRVYTATELARLIEDVGFAEIECFGDLDGGQLSRESRLVVRARRFTAASLGKLPATRGPASDFLVDPLQGIRAPEAWTSTPVGTQGTPALRPWRCSSGCRSSGTGRVSWSRTSSHVAATTFGSGWAKMVQTRRRPCRCASWTSAPIGCGRSGLGNVGGRCPETSV